MRILHVTQRYLPAIGGSELHLAGISTRLAAEGHAVTVATTDAFDFELFWNPHARRIDAHDEVIDSVRVLRFPVHTLPVAQLSYPAVRRLLWLLERVPAMPLPLLHRLARFTPWTPELLDWLDQTTDEFDIVAAMTIVFEPLIAAAQTFAAKHHLPFVVYPLTHLGIGTTPASDSVSRFYTMRHQVDLVVNSSTLIANTKDEADFYHARGMPSERIVVGGPGIEPEQLLGGDGTRLRSRYGLDGVVVGVLSALAYDKGAVHVVEAVRRLWREGQPVHLVMAGAVLEQFRRYLDTLPAEDRHRILVLGSVNHQTKLDLLDAIDMLAMPSRTDSFGIVYLEAWSYGKPVIGAQAWGVRTVIDDGENGLLVPFGDVGALADAIRTLAGDAALRQRMGGHGRAKMQALYTWDRQYPRVRQVYERLTGEPQAA